MSEEGHMDIRIHPLVILHIADHYTRLQTQHGITRVVGALMGEQSGRVVNVVDAFEMAFATPDPEKKESKDTVTIAKDSLDTDMKLFKEAYPRYECLGWYGTGAKIDLNADTQIHRFMQQYNERPLFLLFDSKIDEKARDLPVLVYEEVVHVSGDKITQEFLPTAFKIESEEAERVTAVHCAKVITDVESGSVVSSHYSTLIKAINNLNARIRTIHNFLKDVSQGKIEVDHKILRQIKGMCNRLPTMSSTDFKEDLIGEYNEALLVTYLATVTKSTNMVNEVVDKFNVAFAKQSRRPMFY